MRSANNLKNIGVLSLVLFSLVYFGKSLFEEEKEDPISTAIEIQEEVLNQSQKGTLCSELKSVLLSNIRAKKEKCKKAEEELIREYEGAKKSATQAQLKFFKDAPNYSCHIYDLSERQIESWVFEKCISIKNEYLMGIK